MVRYPGQPPIGLSPSREQYLLAASYNEAMQTFTIAFIDGIVGTVFTCARALLA